MATIQIGGGRRSNYQQYDPLQPLRAQASNAVPTQAVATTTPADQFSANLAEAFGRGRVTSSGRGSADIHGGTGQANPQMARGMQGVGTGLSALGVLSGNSALGQFGGMLGLGGKLGAARGPKDALMTMAGPALSLVGVPGSALGLAKSMVDGDVSMAVNTVLSAINPGLGAINALGSLFGVGTIGGAVKNARQDTTLGREVGSDGLIDAWQTGRAINNDADPVGALINALSPASNGGSGSSGYRDNVIGESGGRGSTGGSADTGSYGGRGYTGTTSVHGL